MKTGNKKNNKLNEKNNLSVQATGSVQAAGSVQETAKRKRGRPSKAVQQQQSVSVQDNTAIKKRGRPKGSKNKAIRKDNENFVKPNKNNSVFIRYSLELSSLPAIDVNDIQQMKTRITEYFTITEQYALKAAVSSLALAFHVGRVTLFNWLNGRTETIKNPECLNTLKNAYNIICSQYEFMLNNGSINPVSGIFLMKNNFGYKDNTDLTITANQDKQETISDITNRANLLD